MKTALITGSSKGLGLEVAKLLALRGYKIILTGRSNESLELARQQLSEPDKHVQFCGDLLKNSVMQALCNLSSLPDIIVHSLGGKIDGDVQPLKEDVLSQSVALNLGIAAKLNLHYLPLMQQQNYGRIIHVSSDASETGRTAPGYAAAKGAINAYVQSTARFYAKDNVMICAVLPGVFLYPNSVWDQKRKTQPDCFQQRLEAQPLKRFLKVSEVAELIAEIAASNSMACAGSLVKIAGAY